MQVSNKTGKTAETTLICSGNVLGLFQAHWRIYAYM